MLVAGLFGSGHRLPSDHGPLALQHFASNRHGVAGPNAKAVADLDQLEGDFLASASGWWCAVLEANFNNALIALATKLSICGRSS